MHVENEGPGVFGELLQAAGAEVRVARLHLGDALPDAAGARRRALDGRADERLRGGAVPVPARRDALSAGGRRARPAGARHLPRRPDDREGRRRGGDEEPRRGGRLEYGEPDRRGAGRPALSRPARDPPGLPVARRHLRDPRRAARCSRPAATATTRPSASGARTGCSSTSRRTARCSRSGLPGSQPGPRSCAAATNSPPRSAATCARSSRTSSTSPDSRAEGTATARAPNPPRR